MLSLKKHGNPLFQRTIDDSRHLYLGLHHKGFLITVLRNQVQVGQLIKAGQGVNTSAINKQR